MLEGQAGEPVLRWLWARVVLGAAGLVCAAGALLLAFLWLIFGESRIAILAATAALSAPVVLWVLVAGRWAPSDVRLVQMGTAWFVVLVLLILGGAALAEALVSWAERRTYATPSGAAAGYVAAGAVMVIAVASLVAGLPLGGARRTRARASCALLSTAALLGLGAAGLTAAPGGCETFRFDEGAWRSALETADEEASGRVGPAERLAGALEQCGTLDGLSRDEVLTRLGAPMPPAKGTTLSWSVGLVNDGLGPGDAGYLTVTFDRQAHVRTVGAP